jgi:uroporphyrinogen decarboxylase
MYTDEWHITYKKVGYYTEQVEYPLADAATLDEIRAFPFPDPNAPGRFDLAERVIAEYGEGYAICGDLECTIFEGSWHMIGMEKYLLDLTMEEAYIFELMDQIQSTASVWEKHWPAWAWISSGLGTTWELSGV